MYGPIPCSVSRSVFLTSIRMSVWTLAVVPCRARTSVPCTVAMQRISIGVSKVTSGAFAVAVRAAPLTEPPPEINSHS